MRDGERVATGSEPTVMRRSRSLYECGCVLVGDEGPRDDANRWENTHPLLCPVHRAIWTWKNPEVGEPGHDEQTEAQRLREAMASALTSLGTGPLKDGYAYAVLEEALAEPPWQPDPRTVKAVVEALRDVAHDTKLARQGHAFADAADFIEERFKPSAPGGIDGH